MTDSRSDLRRQIAADRRAGNTTAGSTTAGSTTAAAMGRRAVLGALLGAVAAPLWAEAPARSLRPRLRDAGAVPAAGTAAAAPDPQDLLAKARISGVLAYAVADLETGQVLESSAADVPVPPASVAKTVTTLYALNRLGPDYRFVTRILRTGPIVNGRLEGDLVLAGSGDPTLDTDRLGDLAANLAALGLREVAGRFLAYAGAVPNRPAIAADQPDFVGYDPAVSGLNLNFNRVYFGWKKNGADWTLGMDARGARFVPPVSMAEVAVVQRDLPIFDYAEGKGRDRWTVAASALGKEGSRWLPVRHPAEYTAEVFQTLCAAQGLTLDRAEVVYALPDGTSQILASQSAALPEILREMLKFSTNLTAEIMGLTASAAGTQAGSAAAMTQWAQDRFGITARFVDHSGLGADNRVTASDLVKVMVGARKSPLGASLMGLLHETGLADAKGKPRKDAPVRVFAKTGTLNFVSGLAGYVTPPKGRQLAFAIFAADVARRDKLPMAQREDPPGQIAWVRRAKTLQQQLIARWVALYA